MAKNTEIWLSDLELSSQSHLRSWAPRIGMEPTDRNRRIGVGVSRDWPRGRKMWGRKPRNSTQSPGSARPQLQPSPGLISSKAGLMLPSRVSRRTTKLPGSPRGPNLLATARRGGRGPS